METQTITQKNVKRFLQCRLRYTILFPSRGEQCKVKGILEEIKDDEGTILRRLPAVELPKKEDRESVTIGPLTDEQIERLEGNPDRQQAPDLMFVELKRQGKVRWLNAMPEEDKTDRQKLEELKKENLALRAKLGEKEAQPPEVDGATVTARAFRFPGTGPT